MPRISSKQELNNELNSLLKRMAMFDDDKCKDFDELMDIKFHLERSRYFNLREHLGKNRTMHERHAVEIFRCRLQASGSYE